MLRTAALVLTYALLAMPIFAPAVGWSASGGAEAPTLDELRHRLALVQSKRETVVTEYRLGKSMMDLAVLKEAGLIAEENALAAMIKKAEEPKK